MARPADQELDDQGNVIDPSLVRPGNLGTELVGVIGPDGRAGSITRGELPEALSRGYRLESPEQSDQRLVEQQESGHQLQTGIESFASTATFGGTDLLAGVLAPEEAARMKARRELNTEGAIAGGVLGALSPGGAGRIIGGVGKAVGGEVAGALGAGVLGRVGGTVAQGAAEGVLFGESEGISQIGLTPGPLTAEQVVSTLGGNMLYGGLIGGGLGGVGGVLGEALEAGRGAVGRAGKGGAAERAGLEIPESVGALDRDAAKVAREAEVSKLGVAREAEARDLYKTAREYNDYLESSWIDGGDSRFKRLMKITRKAVRNSLDSENAFVRYNGARTLDALDKQAQAIREYSEADIVARSKAASALDAEQAVKSARAESLRKGETVNMRAVEPPAAAAAPKIEMNAKVADLLEVNEALRSKIQGIGKAPTSPMLDALDAHLDALAHPPKKAFVQQMGEQVAGGAGASLGYGLAGPIGGAIGYGLASKAAAAVFEGGLGAKLRAGVAKSARTMSSAADSFVSAAAKVTKVAPVLATRVLSSVSFAGPELAPAARPALKTSSELLTAFRARENELRAQVMDGPTGKPVMSPSANATLHQRLAGLWAVDPHMADMVESAARQRVEFLASKLPPRPNSQVFTIGQDRWQPPDLAMRKFARYVEATENPNGVLERFAAGRMSPEDAEAFRVVYPEMWGSMKAQIMGRLPEVQATLPFRKRLMLSLFFDAPIDSSQDPTTAAMLQRTFASEPGSSGGTGQPVPHMGNTKKLAPDPTPAQRMSG